MESQIRKLATFIFYNRHYKMCHAFSWACETNSFSNDPITLWNCETHKYFYNKAEKLLSIVDFEVAKAIIESDVFIID